jgi:hypothetical protein
MNRIEIETHIGIWLKEDRNPYIGIKRSWEQYCKEELNIEHKETYGVIASMLQITNISSKHLEDALLNIQKIEMPNLYNTETIK